MPHSLTQPGSKQCQMFMAHATLSTKANGSFAALPTWGSLPTHGPNSQLVQVPEGMTIMVCIPVMTAATDKQMIAKAVGFRVGQDSYYSRLLLWSFSTIISGAAAAVLGTNYFTADTLTLATGDPGRCVYDSPADATHDAEIRVDVQGCQYVCLYPQLHGTAAATSMGFRVGFY